MSPSKRTRSEPSRTSAPCSFISRRASGCSTSTPISFSTLSEARWIDSNSSAEIRSVGGNGMRNCLKGGCSNAPELPARLPARPPRRDRSAAGAASAPGAGSVICLPDQWPFREHIGLRPALRIRARRPEEREKRHGLARPTGRHHPAARAFVSEEQPMVTAHHGNEVKHVRAAERARRSNLPPVRVGTSGWHYSSWWGPFYPETTKKGDALCYYATKFDAAELNAPFYRTPPEKAVESWRESVPADFRFAWKASKFITHWRRLIVNENSMNLLEDRAGRLGDRLGPILFQLPPRMKANRERLAAFLDALPKHRRYSFEFRHESWYEPAIFDLMSDHDAALCISDHVDAPAP